MTSQARDAKMLDCGCEKPDLGPPAFQGGLFTWCSSAFCRDVVQRASMSNLAQLWDNVLSVLAGKYRQAVMLNQVGLLD